MGNRWLTDDVIETMFDTINLKYDKTICFVCKPTRVMHSSARFNNHRLYIPRPGAGNIQSMK